MYKASETMSPACTLEETLQCLNVSAGTTFPVTLFRSKTSSRKLLFLEAGKDFVDVLLSFLLLPVGSIIHMLTKGPSKGMGVKPVPIGISSIFESVQSFSVSDLQVAKAHLTRPRAAAFGCSCQSCHMPMLSSLAATSKITSRGVWGTDLPMEVDFSVSDLQVAKAHLTRPRAAAIGCSCQSRNLPMLSSLAAISENTSRGVWGTGLPMKVDFSTVGFVKANTTFIVTDNLEIMPLTTNKSVNVFSKLKVGSLAHLEGNDITVSLTQISQLLHSALTSNTCLNEVFGKSNEAPRDAWYANSVASVAFSRENDEAGNSKR